MGCYTKSYLLSLLLLFFVVNKSTTVAGKLSLANLELLNKFLNDFPLDDIMKAVGSPPPPFPPELKVKGVKAVKEHLNTYGYLPDSDTFTDVLDAQAMSSIKEYQKFFNLKVTGSPDDVTRQHMALLRCGAPDKNLTYDLSTANVSWPVGTRWFPNGSMNLTYGFAPFNKVPNKVTKVFEDSFKRWSDAITGLNLTETEKYEDADIRIMFVTLENTTIEDITSFGPEVVGATLIGLLPGKNSRTNNNVTVGAMILDDSKYLVLPSTSVPKMGWKYGVIDMETVVMHQIGHLLGLEHSSHEDSVMYPSILPMRQRKVKLSEDDKEQIKQVYFSGGISGGNISESGINGGGVTKLVGSVWRLVTTTLSLGLASMVLFY